MSFLYNSSTLSARLSASRSLPGQVLGPSSGTFLKAMRGTGRSGALTMLALRTFSEASPLSSHKGSPGGQEAAGASSAVGDGRRSGRPAPLIVLGHRPDNVDGLFPTQDSPSSFKSAAESAVHSSKNSIQRGLRSFRPVNFIDSPRAASLLLVEDSPRCFTVEI